MKFRPVVLSFLFVLSACGAEYQANKDVESLRDQLKKEMRDLDWAESSEASAHARVLGAYRDLETARAEQQFDQLARSGAAGTGEQLRAAKRLLDDPARQSNQRRMESAASQQIEQANRQLEYQKGEVQRQRKVVANTEAKLRAAETALAKLREAR